MTIDQLLVYFFGACALLGGVLMLVARHPMRVALALISCMLSLAGIYAMLGVHVVAVFQVLIYVGAVMVFMVYVIMLLDVRDPSFVRRYSHMLVPGVVLGALYMLWLAQRMLFGESRAPHQPLGDLIARERAILLAFVVAIFALGLFPQGPLAKTESAAREYQQRVLGSRLPEAAP